MCSLDVQVCFPAGTKVVLLDGTVKVVEDILPDDIVRMVHQETPTGEIIGGRVVRTFENAPQPLWRMTFKDAHDEFELRATKEHPFFVYEKGWVAAENLEPGDVCRSAVDAKIVLVAKTFDPTSVPVYNFEVEGGHTYFVGLNERLSVLVHNECLDLIHGTSSEVAPIIVQQGLKPGQNGLIWFAASDAPVGSGVARADTFLKFSVDIKSPIVDIPENVIKKAKNVANSEVKGKYTPEQIAARNKEWGYHYNKYLREYIEKLPAEQGEIFKVPGENGATHYAFKKEGFEKSIVNLQSVTGKGAGAATQAMAQNQGRVDKGLIEAARAKWGDKVKAFSKWGGRAIVIVGAGASAYEVYYAESKAKAITKEVGGWSAAYLGGKAGSSVGARIGGAVAVVAGNAGPQAAAPEEVVTVPLGIAVGGIAGGLIGGVSGFIFGRSVTENVFEWVFE